MTNRISRRALACALLATTSLSLPTVAYAATPAPKFVDTIDDHGVDLASGLPFISIEEGGIGSGPGRVSMQRTWAESAGWTDNWTGGLYPVTDANSVTKMYVQFGGMSDTFSGSGSNWTSDKADGATLVVNADGTSTYTARDGTRINFDSRVNDNSPLVLTAQNCPGTDADQCHVPTSIARPDGLKFTFVWQTEQLCSNLSNPCDAQIYYYQRLSSVTSSAGYKLTISYLSDALGDDWYKRTGVSFTNTANPPSPAPTITYAYPGTGNQISVTDPGGRTWLFTMRIAKGQLTAVRRPGSASDNITYAYDTSGAVNSSTKDGVTNTYLRSVSGTTATETVTNPLSQQTVVTSDTTKGRPTSFKDGLNHTTSYSYDSNDRLTQITAHEGNAVQYDYDARGNITTQTFVPKTGSGLSNIVTTASFDLTCTSTTIVKCNKPNSTTDAKGNVTDYTYDTTHGGVLTVTAPAPTAGAVRPQTRYAYTQVTSASGDLVYMLTGVSTCQTTASCTGTADETKVTGGYNSNLLPISVSRGEGTGTLTATSAIAYDARGRVDTVNGPLADTVNQTDIAKFRYDNADQVIGIISTDPDLFGSGLKNRAIRLTYRPDGQVSKKELGVVDGQSDTAWSAFASAQAVDITFDSNNRPVTAKLSSGGTAYALTQTSYDSLGRVDCVAQRMNTAVYGSLPASACTLGTQGSFGPDRITQTVYNAAGDVTQNKVAVGVTGVTATERTLTYTSNGLLATLKDAENNLTTYEYDGFDRLLKTRFPNTTKGSGTSSTTDYEQLSYDANSNVTSRRLRDSTSIAFTFDNLDRPTFEDMPGTDPDVTIGYDNLGRITTMSQPGYSMSFGYDALSRQTAENQGFGSISRSFDLAGNLTRTTWWDGFYVVYDRLVTGEISKVRERDATTGLPATSGVGVLATYAYDDLGRRTSVTLGNGASQAFTYDPVSRLASLTNDLSGGTTNDLSATISYNPAFQIASTTRTGDAYAFAGLVNQNTSSTANGLNQQATVGGSAASYDTRGNLTSDPTSGKTYTYWSSDMLKSASGGVTLYYDPLLRLTEYDTAVSTRFVHDGPQIAAEVDNPAGAIQKRYVWGDGPDELIVQYNGSGTSNRNFAGADERGSVISLSDSSGALVGINRFDEYGKPQSTNVGRFQYTGQAWLSETGAYSYKARNYLPHVGMFAQADPIGYADSPNLYNYVLSDPVNLVDPLGLEEECGGEGQAKCPPIIVTGRLPGTPETNAANAALLNASSGGTPGYSGPPNDEIVVTGRRPAPPQPPQSFPTWLPTPMMLPAAVGAPAGYNPKKNYCGGEGGSSLPNKIGGVSINDMCYAHDLCYGASGTPRSTCDPRFGIEIFLRLEINGLISDPVLRTVLSVLGGVTGYIIVWRGGKNYYVPK